jgi:hypothetical protein
MMSSQSLVWRHEFGVRSLAIAAKTRLNRAARRVARRQQFPKSILIP